MGFLVWLEGTELAHWVSMSDIGYPIMITSHAIGMGVMAGLALILDLRLLGLFPGIPFAALPRFFGLAWLGFGLNFLSGAGLFAAQAVAFGTDWVFLTKISLVLAGAVTAALLQTAVGRDATSWSQRAAPNGVRSIATLSIGCWVGATVMGRLTAYL